MTFKKNHIWILVWILVYVIGFQVNCTEMLGNKGIQIINGEYYRFFTGLLVHVNLFHVLLNIIALYYTVNYLSGQVSQIKLLILSIIAAIAANIAFSVIYPGSLSVGGSPIIFAMLGLTLTLQILKKDVERFRPNTVQTSWMLCYAILGNIPIFSGNISTLVIHLLAFGIAFLLGCLGIKLKQL
nr:rhomboid family intramembrane serine protease [uncultured Sellimonas sp.]